MPGGRPPKYNTPQEMQEAIDLYFQDNEIPTVTGLALALGFDTRHALLYYEHEKPEFVTTIKKAKTRVEDAIEHRLLSGQAAAGCIFNLKNNFGWKDAQEYTHVTEQDGERKPLGLVWPTSG